MIEAEIRARQAARSFTATGWFPAVESLGGSPTISRRVTGPKRGRLVEKGGSSSMSETLINEQPGAEQTANRAGSALQEALNQERDDLLKYVNRKLDEKARSAGL